MLESIALAAGYRVGLLFEAAPRAFRGALPDRRPQRRRRGAAAALRGGGAGARRHRAHVLRIHAARDRLAARGDAARPGDPRGRSRRPARRGQRRSTATAPSSPASTSITPALLGNDRESIGREKAGILRAGRPAVVSDPLPPQSVLDEAARIGADLRLAGRDFHHAGDRQQWSWTGRQTRLSGLGYPALRGANQLLNASGALAALEALRDRLPLSAQAIRTGLATVELPGRFQVVPGEPTLVLDVAHNPHAVAGAGAKPRPDGLLPAHARGVRRDARQGHRRRCWRASRRWSMPGTSPTCRRRARRVQRRSQACSPASICAAGRSPAPRTARPSQALAAAFEAADPADRIVVFGSFYTVGGVLANGLPQRSGRHAP